MQTSPPLGVPLYPNNMSFLCVGIANFDKRKSESKYFGGGVSLFAYCLESINDSGPIDKESDKIYGFY